MNENQRIRMIILEELYEHALKHPRGFMSKELLQKKIGSGEAELDFNIKYLEDKGLIKVENFLGGGFLAQITVYGIDFTENGE